MAPTVGSRVAATILLLAGTFAAGVLPISVRRTLLNCGCETTECKPSCRARKGKVVTSFLIYLGGGVLLATCLIHLLPEAREGFENYYKSLEKPNEETSSSTTLAPVTTDTNSTSKPTEEKEEGGGHDHEHFPIPEFVVCCGFFAVYLVEEVIHMFLGGHSHTHVPTETRAIRSVSRRGSCHRIPTLSGSDQTPTSHKTPEVNEFDSIDPSGKEKAKGLCVGFSITGLLTVAALSFHSLFEGFAIGLQPNDSGLWILFGAVSVHKFVIAFVVGLEVLTSGGQDRLVIVYMAIFAAMSPIGMIIAMITQTEAEESAPLTVGILNAIATGTLLYVTFCEILQREEEHKNLTGWQQFLATLLGFCIMCVVQYISTLPG